MYKTIKIKKNNLFIKFTIQKKIDKLINILLFINQLKIKEIIKNAQEFKKITKKRSYLELRLREQELNKLKVVSTKATKSSFLRKYLFSLKEGINYKRKNQ